MPDGYVGKFHSEEGSAVYETLPDFLLDALSCERTTDICINPDGTVFLYAYGHAGLIGNIQPKQTMAFLRKAAASCRREFSDRTSILSATLPGFERLEAYGLAVSPDGICATIRKPGPLWTLDDLVAMEAMTKQERAIISEFSGERSIVVSGQKGGCGKTTVVRAILEEPHVKSLRRFSIETDLEVQKPSNGARLVAGEETFNDLFWSTLRVSAQLIIISEVRKPEHAFAFVEAVRTGHPALSTVHARCPLTGARRIFEMGKFIGGIPAIDVATSMELVVHMNRDEKRGRHVKSLATIREEDGRLIADTIN